MPYHGALVPAERDRGVAMSPIGGIAIRRDLGLVTTAGIRRMAYGFRSVPYREQFELSAAYAAGLGAFEVALGADRRLEQSPIHLSAAAAVSQLHVGRFVGFANDAPYTGGDFHDVRQTQWMLRPSVALSAGPHSEISLGPVVKFTSTDSVAGRLISAARPYGFASFGQAGVQLDCSWDTRDRQLNDSTKATTFRTMVSASAYPALWSASEPFARLSVVGVSHVLLPLRRRTVLALRAGGEKAWGRIPYFDAAFLGGSTSLRTAPRQRFAGEAVVHGSAELRVPVREFSYLLPWNVGVLGFVEAGRVFVDGKSPGGWHTGAAGGFWLGVLNPQTSITMMGTSTPARRLLLGLGFDY
jgi:hypothetical protein